MTTEDIPFIDLSTQRRRIGDRIDEAIARVVEHGRFIMGPEVIELETELARRGGARHAVTCSSGTDALLMALLCWDVGPGDAVVVPAFTFPATAEVVVLLGATPVFADVDGRSFNLDPASADAALVAAASAGLRPAAMIAVDLFGQPARYDLLVPVARDHGVHVLADAAQSFGGSLREERVGSLGGITATSFFPAKPLGCYGDGGAVFTDDDDVAEKLRSIRVHGKGRHKYDNVRVGLNARLDTIQAAVLLAKLGIFQDEVASRRDVARRYEQALPTGVVAPYVAPGALSAWAQYTVQVENRDEVAARLRERGVPTAVYYPKPLHFQGAFAAVSLTPVPLIESERLSTRVLSLPMHPYLEPPVQEVILDAVAKSLRD